MTATSRRNRRQPKHDRQPPTPTPPPAVQAAARGATLNLQHPEPLNLQNPKPLFTDLDDRAAAFEAACKQAGDKAVDLWAEGRDHQQQEQDAAAEEMRLQQQLNELAKQRDSHSKQKDGKFAEARHYEEQAKGYGVRAADLRASIATLREAHKNGQRGGPGTAPMAAVTAVDPTDERIEGPVRRLEAAHDEYDAAHPEPKL